MAIVKCNDWIDVYKAKSKSKDVHELSGRGTRAVLTEYINDQLVNLLPLHKDNTLVDIGCGDASFLRKIAALIKNGIGILPSEDEKGKVIQFLGEQFPNITIQKGLASTLPLTDHIADVIVCNGVLILLSAEAVSEALGEIARIAKPGATVYIGEVPEKNEFAGRTYGDSIIKWLWYIYKNRGSQAFKRSVFQVLKACFTQEPFIISPQVHFYMESSKFIQEAKNHGLECVRYFNHWHLDENQSAIDHPTRINYLFKRYE